MLIPHGTVIAIVDGKNWQLWRNAGNEAAPELAELPTPQLEEHNHGSGGRHYSSAGNPAGNQLDEDAHAAAVASWLNGEVQAHRIEQLVVIAAPRTLGELRHHYNKGTERATIRELSKDLIGRQPDEIIAALRAK